MDDSFILFTIVGFLAQIVDGALGMAYGLCHNPCCWPLGCHRLRLRHRCTRPRCSRRRPRRVACLAQERELAVVPGSGTGGHPGRSAGGLCADSGGWRCAAALCGGLSGIMGIYILYRAFRAVRPIDNHRMGLVVPLGAVGGFADAVGGGGWGPVVTTGLVGTGGAPREMIGKVNTVSSF